MPKLTIRAGWTDGLPLDEENHSFFRCTIICFHDNETNFITCVNNLVDNRI